MKRFTHQAVALLIAAVGFSTAAAQRPDPLAGSRAEVYKSIGDVQLKLYVFTPADHQPTDRSPSIIFFFGGGWRSGNPRQFAEHCRYFASRGMVAITAEYRVHSRHKALVRDCVADAKSALRWVRRHSDKLGVDPNRIAASGGSAGGHLAAALGTLDGFDETGEDVSVSARPNALVLFNPGLDLTAAGFGAARDSDRQRNLHARLGATPDSLSPGLHVSRNTPPTILFHGTADATVPFRQAEGFRDAMHRHGNRCELAAYEGASHGFFNYGRDKNRAYVDTVRRADRFLASLGFLEGEPTVTADE